jgi:hypothetical protein
MVEAAIDAANSPEARRRDVPPREVTRRVLERALEASTVPVFDPEEVRRDTVADVNHALEYAGQEVRVDISHDMSLMVRSVMGFQLPYDFTVAPDGEVRGPINAERDDSPEKRLQRLESGYDTVTGLLVRCAQILEQHLANNDLLLSRIERAERAILHVASEAGDSIGAESILGEEVRS